MVAARHKRGFTLVELISVIMVLGIVSLGIFSFIGSGARIFVDGAERQQVLSDSRFVVERLNRELRTAVPTSPRVFTSASRHCIEFIPTRYSQFYTDIPLNPNPVRDTISVVPIREEDNSVASINSAQNLRLVVYPTDESDLYIPTSSLSSTGTQVAVVDSYTPASDDTLTLTSDVRFGLGSPANRFYIAGNPITYCMWSNGEIRRYTNYGYFDPLGGTPAAWSVTGGALMAENAANNLSSAAESPFRVTESTLIRNNVIHTQLLFNFNDEIVNFNNEIHVPNAP